MTANYKRLDKDQAAVLLVDHQAGLLSLVRDIDPDRFKNNVLALPQVKPIGMANPADVYCTKIGGKLNAKENAAGQYSTCTLPSGQEIESWELFRRDHPVKK